MSNLTDFVFAVSEVNTMGSYQSWLKDMISIFNSNLTGNGLTPTYGLLAFGTNTRKIQLYGGNDFGEANFFSDAVDDLGLTSSYQDAYEAIDFIIKNYTFRAGAVKVIIVITDRDRHDLGGPSKNDVLQLLNDDRIYLYCVNRVSLKNDAGDLSLGIDYNGNVYEADGATYKTSSVSDLSTSCSGTGTQCEDYADLVWKRDGSIWDGFFILEDFFTTAFTSEITDDMVERFCQVSISSNEISFYLSPNLTGEKSSFISFNYNYQVGTTIHFRITFYNDILKSSVVYSSFSLLDPRRWFINSNVLEPFTERGVNEGSSETVEVYYIPEFLPQQIGEEQWTQRIEETPEWIQQVEEKSLLCGVDYYMYIESYNEGLNSFDPVTFRAINIPCSQVEARSWREDKDKKYWISSGQGKMDLKVSDSMDQSLMTDISSNRFGEFNITWQGRREDGQSLYNAIWESYEDILVSSGQGYYDRLCPVQGSQPKLLTDHKQNFYILGNTEDNIFVCKCIMPTVVSGAIVPSVETPTTYLCYPGYETLLDILMLDVKMRVCDEDSVGSYVIDKDKVASVVEKQNIKIDIANVFGAYAVRLRNADDQSWGGWIGIDNELFSSGLSRDTSHQAYFIQDDRFLVNWTVPKINGLRRVCCQVLTFFGITKTFCLEIFVNMNVLEYYVEFYQDENLTIPFVSNKGYFIVSEIKDENGFPVNIDSSPYVPSDAYAKVIFNEEQTYNTGDLKFNVIQQGLADQYEKVLTKINSKMYKGSFQVYKHDGIFNKDGLSFIEVVFPDDVINAGSTCLSDETDKYNLMIGPKDIIRYTDKDPEEIFEEYRRSKIAKDLDINEFKQLYKKDDENFLFGNPSLFIESEFSKKGKVEDR